MKKNLLVLHFISHRKFLLSTLHPLVPGHECTTYIRSIDRLWNEMETFCSTQGSTNQHL